MILPNGGISIVHHSDRDEYFWYGGSVTAASFEFLTHIPQIGETITLGPFTLRCIDRNDAASAVIFERVSEAEVGR